jgi:hypothetical protein
MSSLGHRSAVSSGRSRSVAGSLSDRARKSFETIAEMALAKSLAGPGERAEIKPIGELPRRMREKKAVVLTIASDQFRVVLALLCRLDAEARAHFARLNQVDAQAWGEQEFADAVAECGNIIVGAMNRDLGRYFHNAAMSTPNMLDREALVYLDALSEGHRRLFHITGLSIDFYAELFVAPSTAVDFHAEVEALEDQVDSGELEMF